MNALLKKEIRLLLPSWIAALSLAILPVQIIKNTDYFGGLGFFVLLTWLGTIVLSLESFGREFSPGIFCLFMSQPEERKRLWQVKVTTLAVAIVSVLIAFYVSLALRQIESTTLIFHDSTVADALLMNLQTTPALALTAFVSGLWSTLLLRQTVAAMWFVILPPIGIAMSMALLLPENPSLHIYDSLFINVALIIYSAASYLFARWLFFRAQEVGWTGGTISISTWKYFDAGKKSSEKSKKRGAVAALFWKELQLHSGSLFCAAGLLVLHVIAICLRPSLTHKHPVGELASNGFCFLWLMMPVIIGGMAVAEERKLGVMESLLCLPTSRRIQFAIKFFMALFFGTLLGGVMPLVLEKIAAALGAPNGIFDSNGDQPLQHNWFVIFVLIGTAVLTFIAFFASTLTRNFLQAVGIAIATVLGGGLFFAFVMFVNEHAGIKFFGITPWHSILPIIIAIPVIAATLFWLAWLNFKTIHEDRRMWWRNIFWISGTLVFIVASSTLIYNRAWEIFEAAEPPHGAAKFSMSNPPKLDSENNKDFHIRLPDGRVWFDSVGYYFDEQPNRWKEWWIQLVQPLPESDGPRQFMDGSNWVSASARREDFWNEITPSKYVHTAGYFDTVGVQADGTLWISSKAVPETWTGDKMVQFGDETNWRQIARSHPGFGFLLLKTDGTLWRWGNTNNFGFDQWRTNWPTVRADKPYQIGTNSDWKEIFPAGWVSFAKKTDDSIWSVDLNTKDGMGELKRETNYDQIPSKTFSRWNESATAYVGNDGTLWIGNRHFVNNVGWQGTGFTEVGCETNWLAVSVMWDGMAALKSDGSLWKWNFPENSIAAIAKIPPVRLGIHNDWVAIANTWSGVVALAADGSLWLWPIVNYDNYDDIAGMALLKLPKQPQPLGNVFGKAD